MDLIKKAVTLLSGQNKVADPNGSGRSIVRTIIAGLVVAGLVWLAFTVVRDLIIYGLYFRYVDELAEKTGLNKYLINALAGVCLAPFLLGFKYYFFSLSRSKRSRGAALLLGMIIVYNTALYVATKDDVMGKFYTITPEGVRFSDRPLEDGREWQEVTRDNIWDVTHLAAGKRVDAAGRDWVEQKSGLPLLWYSKLGNQIQFYDGPGFDRFTGEPLKPVTEKLYLEWRRSAQEAGPIIRIITKPPGNQATPHPPALPPSQPTTRLPPVSPVVSGPGGPSGRLTPSHQEQAIEPPAPGSSPERSAISRARELDLLLNSFPPSSQRRIAVMFKFEDRVHPSVKQLLYSSLKRQDQRIVTDLFQMPAFESEGFFEEIDTGNTSVLVQTRAFRMVGYLLIGRVSDECRKSTVDSELVTCTMSVVAKLFDQEGRLMDSNRVVGIAPGFSEGAALKDASQKAALALSKELLKSIP